LGFAHLDIDDYFWEQTEVPFTTIRQREKRQQMLLSDMQKYTSFVMSGNAVGWDEPLLPHFDLAVFVTAPTEIRIERLKKREYAYFGRRIEDGGDMRQNHFEFIKWASDYDAGGLDMRSLALHEQWISACPCPVIRVDGTEDYHTVAKNIVKRFYTKPDEPWRVVTYPLGELETYRFTVIFAHYGKGCGGWLYARHKDRDTWETAGGHIEKGETPLDCAKRELREETGATKFYIHPAFDYAVHTSTEFSYGQVFYADVDALGDLPPESEMREVKVFRTIPDAMTYPQILPVVYAEMQRWLGLADKPDEFWDVLDDNRAPTGRTHRRGDPLPDGDNHLDVIVWIMNANSEFLITRRALNKIGYPGMWEIPGGSASCGEDSLTAAIREAFEESGVALSPSRGELFFSHRHGDAFHDCWLFRQDFDLADIVLQEGETIDARTATWNDISGMMERGEFIGRDEFPEFDLLEGIV
jgi:8-oxo-dGTP pyrophosphatase MutT (NUDIX family)/adenylate kinase family enzyme